MPVPRHRDCAPILDWVHELGAEPADLRVLQSRLPRSFQEHAAVRLLLALQTRAVRPRGARFPSAVPKVRSGLTRRGTHYILSLSLRLTLLRPPKCPPRNFTPLGPPLPLPRNADSFSDSSIPGALKIQRRVNCEYLCKIDATCRCSFAEV